MFKLPFEWLLGLRYIRAKRRNGFISFISMSSMIGIALGVTALITVMSIMNGFQYELRERILGMTAHMTVSAGNQPMADWQDLYQIVKEHPLVVGAAPNIEEQGMLTLGQRVKGSLVRGIKPEFEQEVSDIHEKMLAGSLDDLKAGEFNIVLGEDLARSLGAKVGDKVTLVAPQGSVSPVGVLPRLKRLTVSGIFKAGMYEYDSAMAFVHLDDAGVIFKYQPDLVAGLQMKLTDLFKVQEVRRDIGLAFAGEYYLVDWTQQHANFFRAVQMEKRMMFIVLALIIMVAAFNIVSTMVMVVTDKQKAIAVLRTIGATPFSIQMIFMIQGLVIGMLGAILGLLGGIALSLNIDVIVPFIENLFGFNFFPPDVYYISQVPSKLEMDDVLSVSIVAFGLTLLATIYPAWKASRIQPAEALRYE